MTKLSNWQEINIKVDDTLKLIKASDERLRKLQQSSEESEIEKFMKNADDYQTKIRMTQPWAYDERYHKSLTNREMYN